MSSGAAVSLAVAEAAMWALVGRYTGQVGYARPVKAEGLTFDPPVIDCSGWVFVLLRAAMQAENAERGREVFRADDIEAVRTWSDRIIHNIELRTGLLVKGRDLSLDRLPRCATIGLKEGDPVWATNHPRPRGITHIVQVVRRPSDDAPFVSESIGSAERPGIRLTALAEWLDRCASRLDAGEAWAVDPFAMGSRDSVVTAPATPALPRARPRPA